MSSVTVTKSFQVYWNYQVWDLREGQTVTGGLADYLLATNTAQVEQAAAPSEPKARRGKSAGPA